MQTPAGNAVENVAWRGTQQREKVGERGMAKGEVAAGNTGAGNVRWEKWKTVGDVATGNVVAGEYDGRRRGSRKYSGGDAQQMMRRQKKRKAAEIMVAESVAAWNVAVHVVENTAGKAAEILAVGDVAVGNAAGGRAAGNAAADTMRQGRGGSWG